MNNALPGLLEILRLARERTGADVVFLTRFGEGDEVFLVGDGDVQSFGPVHEGSHIPLAETYCEKMIRDCLPQVLSDTSDSALAAALKVTREAGIGSYVGIPIRLSDGTLYGTFCCLSHDPGMGASDDDLDFLHRLSAIAAREIESGNASERILRAQQGVARVLAAPTSLDGGLTGALEAVTTAMGWSAAVLWTRDANHALRPRATWSATGYDPVGTAVEDVSAPAGGFVDRAWAAGEPLEARLTAAHPGEDAAVALGIECHLAFRVVSGHDVVGVIECYCSRQCLDPPTKRALTGLGAQIGQTLTSEGAAFGGPLLTTREIEVLQHAADGVSRSETAARLHLSETTVATHFKNIFGKLGVSDRAAAVAYALRRRLIR